MHLRSLLSIFLFQIGFNIKFLCEKQNKGDICVGVSILDANHQGILIYLALNG